MGMNKLISISLQTMLRGVILGGVFSGLYCAVFLLLSQLLSSHPMLDVFWFFLFIWLIAIAVGVIWGAVSGLVIGFMIGIIKPVSSEFAMFLSFGLCVCYLALHMWSVFGKITPSMADLLILMRSPVPIYVASCAWLGKYAHAFLKRTQLEQSKQSEQSLVVPTA